MAIEFDKLISQADKVINNQGLYKTVIYNSLENEGVYDPIEGIYNNSSSRQFSFNAVLLSEDSSSNTSAVVNAERAGFRLTKTIIVFKKNLLFEIMVDQIFLIDNISWRVSGFKLESMDTMYEIYLGRK
jgi:hypothetical protein